MTFVSASPTALAGVLPVAMSTTADSTLTWGSTWPRLFLRRLSRASMASSLPPASAAVLVPAAGCCCCCSGASAASTTFLLSGALKPLPAAATATHRLGG
eukprot:GHRR01015750.1.p1 GENE.GHRR01015750.1~~GHRR01015750.1.p1  ORF type:complete len:100 (-),score=20.49 GHRR01015750.1:74-373(-)